MTGITRTTTPCGMLTKSCTNRPRLNNTLSTNNCHAMNYDTDRKANAHLTELWSRHRAICKITSADDPSYWEKVQAFTDELRPMMSNIGFLGSLTAKNLLRLGALQSRYRPIAPHAFLTWLSNAVDHYEAEK